MTRVSLPGCSMTILSQPVMAVWFNFRPGEHWKSLLARAGLCQARAMTAAINNAQFRNMLVFQVMVADALCTNIRAMVETFMATS